MTLARCSSSTSPPCPPPWLSLRPGHRPRLGRHIGLLTAVSASTLCFACSQPGSRTWLKCKSFPPLRDSDSDHFHCAVSQLYSPCDGLRGLSFSFWAPGSLSSSHQPGTASPKASAPAVPSMGLPSPPVGRSSPGLWDGSVPLSSSLCRNGPSRWASASPAQHSRALLRFSPGHLPSSDVLSFFFTDFTSCPQPPPPRGCYPLEHKLHEGRDYVCFGY